MEGSKKQVPTHRVVFDSRKEVAQTAHIYKFSVQSKDAEFSFKPGQYIWLVLDELVENDGRGERRALSIISPPGKDNKIELLVRNSDSAFKKALLLMKEGSQASIIGPFGNAFVLSEEFSEPITFIAGGVAIAPFLGIINSLKEPPKSRFRILHFYSSKERSCTIDQICPNTSKFGIETINTEGRFDGKVIPKGTDFNKEHFFITGPQGFINDVSEFLNKKGVAKEHQHYEEFYPEPEGNLKEKDFLEKDGEKNVMLHAVLDSRSHTVITDANGQIIFANPVAERVTGYNFSEMRGNTPRLWGGLMSLDFYKEFWKRKHSSSGFDGEITNRRKNGEIYTAIAHISPILNQGGDVVGYIGTEEDITESKRQAISLEEQNKELGKTKKAMLNLLEDLEHERDQLERAKARDEAILKSAAEGVVVIDTSGKFLFFNDRAKKLLGRGPKEVPIEEWPAEYGIYHLEQDKLMKASELNFLNAMKGQVVSRDQVRIKKPNDTWAILRINASPVVLEGETIGVVFTFIDISKEAAIDRAKTEFVSLASHQLRTPLSAINWYTEMLLSGDAGELSEEQMNYLHEVYEGNQRMVALVNALLNVSRIDLGTFAVEPVPMEVGKVAEGIIKDLMPKIDQKKIKFQKNISPDIPEINADPKLVGIIFQNLLSNAVKYTPDEGSVSLSVDRDDKFINITVSDTGYGIPENQQEKIFTKLFRADNVREKDTDGTGLGMYIVKSIIDKSRGKISFQSKEGKGTTFYVKLPLRGMKKKEGNKELS